MLMRMLRAAFAVLVAVLLGCMPTLALATPATASPPLEVTLAPVVVLDTAKSGFCDHGLEDAGTTNMTAVDDQRSSTMKAASAYPLLE